MKLLLLVGLFGLCLGSYVESSGALLGEEAGTVGENVSFSPSVAFKEGYKNQYMDPTTGHWVSDSRQYATAFKAKRDILKYCKKAYPKLDITNIVEDGHFHKIASWCKETEGEKCKWTHTVRPYKCIVGEFKSEALLVPQGCRFTHEDQTSACDDFAHWEKVATDKCTAAHKMTVRSFALLAPCGLDMFAGVEMVCCPDKADVKATVSKDSKDKKTIPTRFGDENKADEEKDDPYYDDDDSSDDDEDEDEKKVEEKKEKPSSSEQDPYFRVADPDNEHDNFKAAEKRLEQRHRDEVAKKTKEWEELSRRYLKMKTEDPKRAESFKAENTDAFQKTIEALQEEFAEARRQLDEVHQERVMAALNEKKRAAIKEYRDALAEALDNNEAHKVLKTLEAYIRSEEKDRRHSLNRLKHLLKTADPRLNGFESQLLRRLRDIDLRINGTIAMLNDLPKVSAKVKPVIMEFWKTFRKENSEAIGDEKLNALGGEELHAKLLAKYKELFSAPVSTQPRTTLRIVDPVAQVQREVESRFDDIVSKQMPQPMLEDPFVAHAKQESHHHSASVMEETKRVGSSGVGMILAVAGAVLLVGAVLGIVLVRRSNPHYQGVPTADASLANPESRHLNGMQAAGYENPTYRFFEEKA